MRSWLWKDAEKLDWYVEHGRYSRAEVDTIRAEGGRAVERLRRDGCRGVRIPPAPSLPSRWDAD